MQAKLGSVDTARRRIGRAKQFSGDAVDRELIPKIPSSKLKTAGKGDRSKSFFVTQEMEQFLRALAGFSGVVKESSCDAEEIIPARVLGPSTNRVIPVRQTPDSTSCAPLRDTLCTLVFRRRREWPR